MHFTNPRDLTWQDVDPGRYPFDSDGLEAFVRAAGPARAVPGPPVERSALFSDPAAFDAWRTVSAAWADAMSHVLAEHYGPWVAGWRWARGEGDFDGGPIGSWCCPDDTITTAEATLERVVAAVREWREWLEFLAGWFDAHPFDLAAVEDQRPLWESTCRHLMLQVMDRTDHQSGWHGHCKLVLTWFLTRWGVDPDAAAAMVARAVDGRFQSWTAPDVPLVHDVAEKLTGPLTPGHAASGPPRRPDHLRDWLTIRDAIGWQEAVERVTANRRGIPPSIPEPEGDGVVADILAFDAAIDRARADGLLAALDLARADAARGAALDFELMRRWQRHILGTGQELPEFRTLPAFAKAGRERYGIDADTRGRFDRCLAQSRPGYADLPLSARAARAYLDVCFFHPFDDGNSRAALLALVFVLAREGAVLDDVCEVRRWPIPADDPRHVAGFVGGVEMSLRHVQ